MYKLSRTRVILIIGICLIGLFLSIPNFVKDKSSLPSWWQPVNLGLDLQGGSNLLLEVDFDTVLKERMATIEDSIRATLREGKIRYVGLSADDVSVRVKIESESSRSKAINMLKKVDDGIVVNVEGDTLVVMYSETALIELRGKVVEQSIEIVRRRIDELGTKEPVIQRQGANRIVVQLPGLQNPEYVKTLLGKTAKMSFHLVDSSSSAQDARRGKLSSGSRLVSGQDGGYYVIQRKAVVGGEHLTDAQPQFQDGGEAVVSFRFNTIGGKKFGEATKNNIGERLAIVLDNEVISAPTIQSAILGGSGVITGSFSIESANDLALLLRSGALPAPLTVLEERTVGAGLGADSIRDGVKASIIGLIAVIIFIIAAYGLFGLFTTITVLLNLFLMLGALSFMGATLTLPGIAGIILTIGMAVDANVLIFERMREEVKARRSTKDAAEAGFTEAWSTIVDSNLTTLVAAFVLFYFGTGPVRGFAVTLTIGVATSMFTSVTVTRLMIAYWIAKYKPTKLPI